ncbi:MAG TPA: ABC transporter ATP-binding protein [Pyrodictium delaneyi]|uniref:Probable branched-chain amino acid transport ATP-binding protein LivG n=1 Tax=Pyrodictium delaneyi TaxID=1273541 RepID=A0A832ZTF5_9CREN|nr:ABC transporter ATP-binding protein [Pyrodictium delaneyi]
MVFQVPLLDRKRIAESGEPSCSGDKILCVEKVKKYFGGVRAVDGVSLSIPRRSIVGLIGPNGSGKTTLFNLIAGYYKPDSGEIWFDGKRIDGLPPYEIYKYGLVRTFQTPRMWTSLTVFENVITSAKDQRGESPLAALVKKLWAGQEREIARRAWNILGVVQLQHVAANMSTDISGGQMKLTEIGRALNAEPKMLLLDEPAAGVNPTLARNIFENIVKLRDELGITFFIIEHRLEILFDYVDYVYVMHQGRIIAQGKPAEVAENPAVVDIYMGG